MAAGVLAERGLTLQSIPRNQLSPDDPNARSAIVIANKVDLTDPEDVETFRDLYAGALGVWPVSAAPGAGLGAGRRRPR